MLVVYVTDVKHFSLRNVFTSSVARSVGRGRGEIQPPLPPPHWYANYLAKCSGRFYKLRSYVTEDVLRMVYPSLVYSRLQYGIIIWATGTKTLLQEIRVLQNNIIRILTYNKKFSHVTPLYKKLNLLKFDDIYELELA